MKHLPSLTGCRGCSLNRRSFLAAGCAVCAGAASTWLAGPLAAAAPQAGRRRLRILYALHAAQQPGPDWPNKGFDFAPVMRRCTAALVDHLPGFEFIATEATGPEQAARVVGEDKDRGVDGYIVYQMNCWNQVVQTVAATGKPVLYADFQFGGSGGFLVYNAAFLRSGAGNVGFVASSKPKDLLKAAECFEQACAPGGASGFAAATAAVRRYRTPKPGSARYRKDPLTVMSGKDCVERMKASKILAIRDQNGGPAEPILGVPVEWVPFSVLNEAWTKADRDQARSVADAWVKASGPVEGVARETLDASAAMYLAQKAVMKQLGAGAITINCLGGFYGNHIHAYPCLGFHQLLNEGLVGACECDIRSTAAMVALTTLTGGRPGYISDPVIDTAKRQIIYAHCVASNRPFGPAGPANPFRIMTHSEDRQGASVRSELPVGYLTTTVQVMQERKEILLHRAKAVANDPDDRACRTKLCAEPVGDIEKLFTQWDRWGWHRVTWYGDLKEPVCALADALGWKVVEEA